MRKKFRFLTVLAVCVMVLSCFSVTAFAYADDTDQNLPVTEATQPEQQPAVTAFAFTSISAVLPFVTVMVIVTGFTLFLPSIGVPVAVTVPSESPVI